MQPTSTPRIPPLPAAERDERTTELLESLRFTPGGPDLNIFTTLARHPTLLRRWAAFGGTLLFGGELPARDREVLILRTAWRCRTDYEWGQHVVIARAAGLTDEEIALCARDAGGAPPDLALLVRAADELHADSRLGDATWNELAARYTDRQLIEVCMVVGQYHLVAFTLNSLGVEREEGVVGLPD
jgi:alkylhydroperoxidase family enzyme